MLQNIHFENTKQNKFIEAFVQMKHAYLTGCLPENTKIETAVRKQGRLYCVRMKILTKDDQLEFSSAHRSPFLAAEFATDHLRDEILKRNEQSIYP